MIEFYAGVAPLPHGETPRLPGCGFARMRRELFSGCALVSVPGTTRSRSPCGSPGSLPLAGNAMIFKLAEVTPALGARPRRDLPRGPARTTGGLQRGAGHARVGRMLVGHPDIAKVSTGEVTTGQAVMADAAATLKKITSSSAASRRSSCSTTPISAAPQRGPHQQLLFSTGQGVLRTARGCVRAARRRRGVLDGVAERAAVAARRRSLRPETVIGPLVSREHHAKVMGLDPRPRLGSAATSLGAMCPTTRSWRPATT